MKPGILDFHGNVAEHAAILELLGHKPVLVRSVEDLSGVTHLIIPGGESTVISKFLFESGLAQIIIERVNDQSLAIFGTCAGAILLAKEVTGKKTPKSLGLLDIAIERNAYGTQAQSFEDTIRVKGLGTISVRFIRAPVITKVSGGVEVLTLYGDQPVVVQSKRILATTCHPELLGETTLHEYFLTF